MKLTYDLFRPKISLEQLALFSGNLATCVSAGMEIPKSLNTCRRSSAGPELREILTSAAKQTAKGTTLYEALEPHKRCFPPFFLPVVRCGEESGHLDEALHYLENHCRLLIEPTRIMRNTWFVPLCLMLGGTAICIVTYWFMAPWAMTIQYIIGSVRFFTIVAIGIWAVINVPFCRAAADYVRLLLPVIGPAERELTLNRIFHAMNLLYTTGGRRVEEMIRLAADSAANLKLRADFLRAAKAIESGSTIGEAFSAVPSLPFHYATNIVAGEEAGRLEEAFNTICRQSSESVLTLLAGFQSVFFRIVTLAVILSVADTLFSLTFLRH